ncbi:hypothetical protein K9L67_01310 [Candidatus Woesearchaeota archaeon]|nr:hypothetical protein [Candidatus Woesearchaeota archaeon]MCF7900842.1 hypothetical protein [Candidatus Woesearchaeota archaeon]MCF8013836.1 hypothetical protein [Candidatus Woesearchaeota archaeon]
MLDIFSYQNFEILFFLLIGLAVLALFQYIYYSFAFMYIGKKAKIKNPAIAWVPIFGPSIVSYRASKMNRLPWYIFGFSILIMALGGLLLLLNTGISAFIFLAIVLVVLSYIGMLYFSVMGFIWLWKMFKRVNKPGWWSLIPLFALPFNFLSYVPGLYFLGFIQFIFGIWFLIVIGIAAWSKN